MPPFAVFPDDRMGKKKITWLEERGGEELPPRGQRGQRLPWGGLLGGVREWKDGEGPARPPPALCCHTVFTNDKVLFGDRVSSSCIQLPCRGLLRDLPLDWKLSEARDVCLLCSPSYPQGPGLCLAQSD